MLVPLTIALCLTLMMLAVFQFDEKVVQNLPKDNKFRKWWNRHVADRYPD